jgi:hypothetical protein
MAQSKASMSSPPAMSEALWHSLQFSDKNLATSVGGAASRAIEKTKRTNKNISTNLTSTLDGRGKIAISFFSRILCC